MLFKRWIALVPAIFVLAACAGTGVSPVSTETGRPQISAHGAAPDAVCPKGYLTCKVFRNSTGLVLYLVLGTQHRVRCDQSVYVERRRLQAQSQAVHGTVRTVRQEHSREMERSVPVRAIDFGLRRRNQRYVHGRPVDRSQQTAQTLAGVCVQGRHSRRRREHDLRLLRGPAGRAVKAGSVPAG